MPISHLDSAPFGVANPHRDWVARVARPSAALKNIFSILPDCPPPSLRWMKIVFLCLFCFGAASLHAEDWPQYRGANQNGVSTELIRTNWNEEPPRLVWSIPIDPALSSLAISGRRVFTQVRRLLRNQATEFCIALDADTGAELWATPVDTAFYPNEGVGTDDGPRTTPSVDGQRVFVLTSYLRLFCLDAATGQEIWSKNLVTEFGSNLIAWQNAASPLLVGDLVILNSNAANQCLMGFRKLDGSLAWKGQNDHLTHASPVTATIRGVQQVIFFAQSGLVSVVPETGAVLWRFPLNYNGVSVAASPVVSGDLVYCSRAYPSSLSSARAGAVLVSVTNVANAFSATQVWYRTNQLMNHWGTPVHYQGHLYGVYGQFSDLTFKCVELATGTVKWTGPWFGYGSVLVANGKILALNEIGELVLVEPNPAAYSEVARFRPFSAKSWNTPAISNGRIYVRGTTAAACVDVAPVPPASLKLTGSFPSANSLLRLFVGNTDASPLDTTRAAKITVSATTNLATGNGGWTKLTNAALLTNGLLRLDVPLAADVPQQFFRAEERP